MSEKKFDFERMFQLREVLYPMFQELKEAKTIDNIESLCASDLLVRYRFDNEKYPELQFQLNEDDIRAMMTQGVLDEKLEINGAKLSGPLARLLYAVLWKQGDLLKVQHIIKGIMSKKEETSESALVFYQFGKHLASADEPIIDQHVLRAYAFYEHIRSGPGGEFKSKSVLSKNDQHLVEEYKKWLRQELNEELRRQPKYTYHVDKLMFSIGKYIKAYVGSPKDYFVYSPS